MLRTEDIPVQIVVVGAGAMGLSAGRVLAGRGHQVQVVEAHQISHGLASSSGASRLWRLAHVEPEMVRQAQHSIELWRHLERRTSSELLLTRGLLVRGAQAGVAATAVQSQGAHMDVLGWAALASLFPELARDERRPVFWQPDAGVLLAAKSLAVQTEQLYDAGGKLCPGERVRSIDEGESGVRVQTDAGVRMADVVVVTAGPWSGSLLQKLGLNVKLEPVLEQVCYFGGGTGGAGGGWATRPCFYDWGDEIDPLRKYCMPTPGVGYKIGIDHQLRDFHPADMDRRPSGARTRETEAVVAKDFPGFDPISLRAEVCTYTNSPDDHFILDRLGSVVIGCGDSGQAFKFSPLIGEYLADLAEGRAHPAPGLFGLARLHEHITGSLDPAS